ncbi:retinol-binding protein 3-like [Odontesthes bonariensis]|uniref:retinol-binding protein 3-like n=1 Tax=Odontesthes bonariensis TaxID=219752 RepID=UPI003F58486A
MEQHSSPLPWILLLCSLSVNSSFQPALVLEMAKILLENYSFPENLVGMQEAIQKAINSGEILQISDRKTLAAVLTVGVQGALNDPRLTVTYEPNFVQVMPPSLRKEQLIRLVRNSFKVDILENNVGYLRIDDIIGEETIAKLGSLMRDNIWDKIAQTSSLIFDLRYSTAGELSGVPFIISYFSDPEPPIHIDTIYDRPSNKTKELWTTASIMGEQYGKKKDVVILTSRRTIGAAEAVAYTLKNLKRAITVGERSAGGSVKVQKIRIAQSDFYITVPVARSVNPVTGQSWEVSGVSPTVNVVAKEAVAKAKSLLAVRIAIPKSLIQGAGELHMTGSAAEVFTRTMKDLNRATVIGEPTIGGSLSSGTYQIRDSVLYASIPNQVVLSATTGKVWSFSGVEPHVIAHASEALQVAQKIIAARLIRK